MIGWLIDWMVEWTVVYVRAVLTQYGSHERRPGGVVHGVHVCARVLQQAQRAEPAALRRRVRARAALQLRERRVYVIPANYNRINI